MQDEARGPAGTEWGSETEVAGVPPKLCPEPVSNDQAVVTAARGVIVTIDGFAPVRLPHATREVPVPGHKCRDTELAVWSQGHGDTRGLSTGSFAPCP